MDQHKQQTEQLNKAVVNNASSVSFATLISRLLGYIRDMLIANFFGATMVADAFFVAYRIPNLLRRLLGEGSLSTSFIPVYTEYLTKRDRKESVKLIKVTLGAFGMLFVILTVLGIIFAPQIVSFIAPGFKNAPDKFRLTVYLTKIMFPFLTAIGLGAIMLGVLNSWRMFFIPAIAPVMLSISEIIFILFICPLMDLPIAGLAIGVVIGGFVQFLFQLIPVIKKEKNILPVINLKHPGIRKVGSLMLPAIIGLSIMQINSFVDTICATLLKEGSVTHLYYGNRLVQLPLALFGTAVATVALPMMSESAAKNQIQGLKETLSFSMRTISFLIIPASVGLVMLGHPLVKILFERGRFLSADTVSTAWVLSCYAFGLFFYAGVKVWASAFYSLQNTKTPVIISSVSMLINVILNISVVTISSIRSYFGAGGLALATAISSAVNLILLAIIFIKINGSIKGKEMIGSILKHITGAAIMGICIFYIKNHTVSWSVYVSTFVTIISGILIYTGVEYMLSAKELIQIRKFLFKQ